MPSCLAFRFFCLAMLLIPVARGMAQEPMTPEEEQEYKALGHLTDSFTNQYPDGYEPYRRDQPMRFSIDYYGIDTYWISAQGLITKDTPKQFLDILETDWYRELREWSGKNPYVYIHSCGGDERAAMRLGYYFERMKFKVIVAQSFKIRSEDGLDNNTYQTIGECRGACLLAAWGSNGWIAGYPSVDYIKATEEANKKNGKIIYYPTLMEPFLLPREEIYAHAGRMGVDLPLLSSILPRQPGEKAILTSDQSYKLGLRLREIDLTSPIRWLEEKLPAEELHPCAD